MSPLGKALMGLHAWGGMIFSWLLIPVFITGSIAVFEPEVSHWMQPELTAHPTRPSDAVALAEAHLNEHASDQPFWRIRLPSEREPHIGVAWGKNPRQLHEATLDAVSGEPLHERETEGGHFFTHFHADLLLGVPGRWIVGAAGIVMLAALVSGILIHHRFFAEFFTLRPRAGKRRTWLDLHNLSGVASLPFLLMITYTGCVILAETFMPAATHALYDGNPRANRAEVVKSFERKPSGVPAGMLPLATHLAAAEAILGEGKVSSLLVRHPGDRNGLVQAYRHVDDRLAAVSDHVTFDAANGTLFGQQTDWNPMTYAYRAQVGLHTAHFGGLPLRWLYFLSGLLGALMMAAGTALLLRKRRQRAGEDRPQRLLDALGAASIPGSILASLAYLAANRLIPADTGGRETLEIATFFAVWAITLIHALLRRRRAWHEQFVAASVACALLALADTYSGGLVDAARRGVDLTLLATGALLFASSRRFFRTGDAT